MDVYVVCNLFRVEDRSNWLLEYDFTVTGVKGNTLYSTGIKPFYNVSYDLFSVFL